MHPGSLIGRSVVALTFFFFATCDAGPPVRCHRGERNASPCGMRGKLRNAQIEFQYYLYANPGAATSLNDCRDQCVRRGKDYRYPLCGMFYYNATSKVCTLLNSAVPIVDPDPKSDTIFFSRRCFSCAHLACPATPDPNTNLLDNPGFENSDTLVGPWYLYQSQGGDSGQVVRYGTHPKQPGIMSSNALRVKGYFEWHQEYRQCVGQTHRVEYDIYVVARNPSDEGARTAVGDYRGLAVFGSRPPPASGQVRRVIGFYNAAADTGILVTSADSYDNTTVFDFDNVVVRPVNYTLAKNIGKEIVVNGGFEKGTEPWHYKATYGSPDPVGQFDLVRPGLGGTPQALQFRRPMGDGYTLKLVPKLRTASVRLGKVHRLSLKTDPVIHITYLFADGTVTGGSSADDQYFYANADTFPVVITSSDYENDDTITNIVFDEFSIHEIED